jgi:hypothetical protein
MEYDCISIHQKWLPVLSDIFLRVLFIVSASKRYGFRFHFATIYVDVHMHFTVIVIVHTVPSTTSVDHHYGLRSTTTHA